MEWNSEHTQLQLIYVTGTAQSKLNLLGLFAHSRTFMTQVPTCLYIQSQTLTQKARVWSL